MFSFEKRADACCCETKQYIATLKRKTGIRPKIPVVLLAIAQRMHSAFRRNCQAEYLMATRSRAPPKRTCLAHPAACAQLLLRGAEIRRHGAI